MFTTSVEYLQKLVWLCNFLWFLSTMYSRFICRLKFWLQERCLFCLIQHFLYCGWRWKLFLFKISGIFVVSIDFDVMEIVFMFYSYSFNYTCTVDVTCLFSGTHHTANRLYGRLQCREIALKCSSNLLWHIISLYIGYIKSINNETTCIAFGNHCNIAACSLPFRW